MIGSTAFLNEYYSKCFEKIVMYLVYSYRIRVEEEALISRFGPDYIDYCKETVKMIPLSRWLEGIHRVKSGSIDIPQRKGQLYQMGSINKCYNCNR